jgi:hypothetical protein
MHFIRANAVFAFLLPYYILIFQPPPPPEVSRKLKCKQRKWIESRNSNGIVVIVIVGELSKRDELVCTYCSLVCM